MEPAAVGSSLAWFVVFNREYLSKICSFLVIPLFLPTCILKSKARSARPSKYLFAWSGSSLHSKYRAQMICACRQPVAKEKKSGSRGELASYRHERYSLRYKWDTVFLGALETRELREEFSQRVETSQCWPTRTLLLSPSLQRSGSTGIPLITLSWLILISLSWDKPDALPHGISVQHSTICLQKC